MTHSPEQVSDDDDWLPADWLDWLDDDTLDCELLDGLLWLDELWLLDDEPLERLLAEDDELR